MAEEGYAEAEVGTTPLCSSEGGVCAAVGALRLLSLSAWGGGEGVVPRISTRRQVRWEEEDGRETVVVRG